MYWENVSAKPDSGRAITHSRVSVQNGRLLVTMSRITPRGQDGVRLGEHGAVGEQIGLRRVAAVRRVVAAVVGNLLFGSDGLGVAVARSDRCGAGHVVTSL